MRATFSFCGAVRDSTGLPRGGKGAFLSVREARVPNVVEKPITLGRMEARGRKVIEKPITLGRMEARGRKVIEKPITFGVWEARGRKVIEKPITFGAAEARGLNVIEKPITFDAAEARGRKVIGKPNTYGGRGGVEDGWRRLECRAQRCGGKQLPFIHLLVNKRLLLRQWLDKQHLILRISTKVTKSNPLDALYPLAPA
ncbi:hypothetical protein [Paenibacillus sp. FSL M7-0896]|uniref:hypothetical protein n=1 Tax=Paenibacillus sp. FSL M7-0896 TaxID=2921610 RepID=UPI0030DC211D